MICTCTMNPSLDLFMDGYEPLTAGKKNRSKEEYYEVGGKGIAVSVVLNHLGIPSRALGFLGGFVQDYYIQLLQKYSYIRPNFTYIEGLTRINIKYVDSDAETDMNAAGPKITDSDMESMRSKVNRLDEGDIFVLAGALMKEYSSETYAMLQKAQKNGVKICLDTGDGLAKEYLQEKPFAVQVLAEEAARFYDTGISEEENRKNAVHMHDEGAENVILIHEEKRTVLFVCKNGIFEGTLDTEEPVIKTVGMSSAVLAGFLMHYQRSLDAVESFKYGCAAGKAMLQSTGFEGKDAVERMKEKVVIKEVAL